jgi:hypothetical protein
MPAIVISSRSDLLFLWRHYWAAPVFSQETKGDPSARRPPWASISQALAMLRPSAARKKGCPQKENARGERAFSVVNLG